MTYEQFFTRLQSRYPTENIEERLADYTAKQDAVSAKSNAEHAERQQSYAEATKEIEAEVRAYFGSSYSRRENPAAKGL